MMTALTPNQKKLIRKIMILKIKVKISITEIMIVISQRINKIPIPWEVMLMIRLPKRIQVVK